jgi:hypothetical protein
MGRLKAPTTFVGRALHALRNLATEIELGMVPERAKIGKDITLAV